MSTIKNLDTMKESEILVLTTEDLERHIKLRLLDEGIKIPVKPTEPTYQIVPEPDVIVYKVTGFDGYFRDKDEAETLRTQLENKQDNITGTDYTFDYSVKMEKKYFRYGDKQFQVEPLRIYSNGLYSEIVDKVESNKKLKTSYEDLKKSYDSDCEATTEIRSDVYDKFSAIVEKYDHLDSLKRNYVEYLNLANGDAEDAMKFFKKAYSVGSDEEAYIIKETSKKSTGKEIK